MKVFKKILFLKALSLILALGVTASAQNYGGKLKAHGHTSNSDGGRITNLTMLGTLTAPGIVTSTVTVSSFTITRATGPNLVPAGAIMPFYLSACPIGWTKSDGTNGTPNLIGAFIRGIDTSGTVDPVVRTLGSYEADAFKSHSHAISYPQSNQQGATPNIWDGNGAGGAGTMTTANTGDSETRPKNIALLYCMKL